MDEKTSFQEIKADLIRADDSFQCSPGADAVFLARGLYDHDLIWISLVSGSCGYSKLFNYGSFFLIKFFVKIYFNLHFSFAEIFP